MARFCSKCGTKNAADAVFCDSCGGPMATAADPGGGALSSPAASPPQQAAADPRRGLSKGVIAAGVLAIVAIGLAVVEFALPGRRISSAMSGARLALPGGSASGAAYLVGKDGKWGYVDAAGAVVVPMEWDPPPTTTPIARRFIARQEAPYPVYRAGAWMLVDKQGKQLGSRQFEEVRAVSGPIVCGRVSGRWGCVDASGREAIAFIHEDIYRLAPGILSFKQGQLWGLMDDHGTTVKAPASTRILGFSIDGSVACALFDDKMIGIVDRSGNEVGTKRYKSAACPPQAEWVVKTDSGWALADIKGEIVSQIPGSDRILSLSKAGDGLFIARQRGGGTGLIDRKGTWVVKPQEWLDSQNISTGFAGGRSAFGKTLYGAIDAGGNVIVPRVFDRVEVSEDIIIAEIDGQIRLLDGAGNVVWPKDVADGRARQATREDLVSSKWEFVHSLNTEGADKIREVGRVQVENSGAVERMLDGGKLKERSFPLPAVMNAWTTIAGQRHSFMLYENLLVHMTDDGWVRVFRRVGRSDLAVVAAPSGGSKDRNIGTSLGSLLAIGGGGPIGKWHGESQDLEFFEDGTMSMREDGQTFGGKWMKLSDGRLKVDLVMLGMPMPPLLGDIESDKLTLTDGARLKIEVSRAK